jgi:hypothetical protein
MKTIIVFQQDIESGPGSKTCGHAFMGFFLGKQGITLSDYDKEETQIEIESAQWLSKKKKK